MPSSRIFAVVLQEALHYKATMTKYLGRKIYKIVVIGYIIICSSAFADNDISLSNAWRDVGYLDFRQAALKFEDLYKSVEPGSAEWRKVTLGLALCLHQRQPDTKDDKERAEKLYDALIAASDGKPIQATALLLRGKLAQLNDYFGDKEDFIKAADYYRRILRDWPESICADEAALYLAQTSIFTMDKDATAKSIIQLENWIVSHPDNAYAATHWLLIALAHRTPLENQAAAVDTSVKAIEFGLPKEMKLDTLYWRIATMAQNSGKNEIARDFYMRIIVEIKRSAYTYISQQKIIEMGYDAPELIDPFDN